MALYGMRFTAIAAYAPPNIVTNATIAARLRLERNRINKRRRDSGQSVLNEEEEKAFKTTDRWIKRFIGFSSRRFVVSGMGTSDLAAQASQLLVQNGVLVPDELDAILFGRVTPSYRNSPSDACLLHAALGLKAERDGIPVEIFGLDGEIACSTWGAMLQTAYARIRSGMSRRILLIGADAMSTTINWRDRAFATVLGDAGTAVLCEAVPEEEDWFSPNQFWSWMGGEFAHVIKTPKGGSKNPITSADELATYQDRLSMDGKAVKEFFVPWMSERGIDAALTKAGWQLSDLDLAVFHEANLAQLNSQIANNWTQRGFHGEVLNAQGAFGNTTSASIPLSLALNPNHLEVGKQFALSAFGGGFSASITFGTIRHPIVVITHM